MKRLKSQRKQDFYIFSACLLFFLFALNEKILVTYILKIEPILKQDFQIKENSKNYLIHVGS